MSKMIRCSECKQFAELPIQTKTFYYCGLKPTCGTDMMKLWDKVPKAHPRWCPLWREEKKNAEQGK